MKLLCYFILVVILGIYTGCSEESKEEYSKEEIGREPIYASGAKISHKTVTIKRGSSTQLTLTSVPEGAMASEVVVGAEYPERVGIVGLTPISENSDQYKILSNGSFTVVAKQTGVTRIFVIHHGRDTTIVNVESTALVISPSDPTTATIYLDNAYDEREIACVIDSANNKGVKHYILKGNYNKLLICGLYGCNPFTNKKVESIDLSGVTGWPQESYGTITAPAIPEQTFRHTTNFEFQYLQKIILPDETKIIGHQAFNDCKALREVVGHGVVVLGGLTFRNCSALTKIDIRNVTTIIDAAFYACNSLSEIDLPNAITFGDDVFGACPSLTKVSLPKVETIGKKVFKDCKLLTKLDFPNAIILGEEAFQGCSSLQTINAPKVKTIEGAALDGCNSLTDIGFPSAVTLGSGAFRGCSLLTKVNLPKVETIGEEAFQGCSSLQTINAPKVRTIENDAFSSCNSLTEIEFPSAVTLGSGAFGWCSLLTKVSLPKVETLGDAFGGCSSLIELSLPKASNIPNGLFSSLTKLNTLDLSVKGNILINGSYTNDYLGLVPNSHNCNLILNADKKNGGSARPWSSMWDYGLGMRYYWCYESNSLPATRIQWKSITFKE